MSYLEFMHHARFAGHGKWEQYLPIYERHFAHFFSRSPTVVELGVGDGNSLKLWRTMFGANATIVGIDVNSGVEPPLRSKIFVGRQEDTDFLAKVLEKTGTPDIVIDDCSHEGSLMLASFDFLYPKMSKHGVYLVEDLHAEASMTFLQRAKELSDELQYTSSPKMTDFAMHTVSMHFYESIVVFERGTPKQRLMQKEQEDEIRKNLEAMAGKP